MKVIIVGGGIGGLTTALMLHARGIDCELFEQAEGIRELGVTSMRHAFFARLPELMSNSMRGVGRSEQVWEDPALDCLSLRTLHE